MLRHFGRRVIRVASSVPGPAAAWNSGSIPRMTPIHFGLSWNFIGRRRNEIEIAQIAKHSLICFPNMSVAFSAVDFTDRGRFPETRRSSS